MNDPAANDKIAQMNIRLPAHMKLAIKASVSMAGVPLKQIAQDALLLYFHRTDEALTTRRARVVSAFNAITGENKEIAPTASAPKPESSTPDTHCGDIANDARFEHVD